MQSHDCAKYLRFCTNLGLINGNQEKTGTTVVYSPQLYNVFQFHIIVMSFFTHVSAKLFQSQHFDCTNEFAFRKSGYPPLSLFSRQYQESTERPLLKDRLLQNEYWLSPNKVLVQMVCLSSSNFSQTMTHVLLTLQQLTFYVTKKVTSKKNQTWNLSRTHRHCL